jgi:translation initiation factor 3 subunit J
MSDLDWDDEEFEPSAVVQEKAQWDDEEEEEEEEVPEVAKPTKKPTKKAEVKAAYVDETLADPIAEKLRQQKLVEEADLKAAIELFGSEEDFKDFNLETFEPKNAKDFEKLATASVKKHFYTHRNSPHYKVAVKTFIKVALSEFPGADVKEIESHVAALRNEKIKKEKEMQQKSKKATSGSKKKFINTGSTKGDAGLDDYKYEYQDVDDQYDFM